MAATSYSVVLDSLIGLSNGLDAAANDLLSVRKSVEYQTELGADTMGVLGRLSGFPQKYEEVRTTFKKRLDDGYTALYAAATEVLDAEKRYAAQDESWWRKYGYLKDNTKPTKTPTAEQDKTV